MSQYYERPIEFRVASVFSNYMVLQRNKNINIFGEGVNGTEVCVTLIRSAGTEVSAKALVKNNKWMVVLPPQGADRDCVLKVKAHMAGTGEVLGEKKFLSVDIGEVWLAGGQSNMELELQNCQGGKESLQQDRNPNVRFYYTQKNPYKNKAFFEAEERSGWQTFDCESARAWSAVGYYFGRKLSKDLEGVTVGIIGCNWGGTSASAWMSKEALLEDRDLSSYVEEFEAACGEQSVEAQEEAYDEYVKFHAAWEKNYEKLLREKPDTQWAEAEEIIGKCQWPGPMNVKNPYRPGGLYECMLQRVCPYSLKGFLFYQGESDDHKPHMYYKLFSRMIRQWREDFGDNSLPFLFVQLPMHKYEYDEDFKHWPLIREAQMDVYETVKNTGVAVIIDKGEFNNIHPLDKVSVGERLELQALVLVYSSLREEDAFGPLYKSCIYHENNIELLFDYAADGFEVKGELSGFEVAGADKNFVTAKASICGDRIFVSSPEVESPLYVRYLWTNYAEVSLFGKNGLPVAPFRTCRRDDKRDVVQTASIQQIMEV